MLAHARTHARTRTQKHTCAAPRNHDTFHFDWQELLPGIKARYYLSCPVRQGLTGVTFSLERQAARVYITPPAASSLPSVCLPACRGSRSRFMSVTRFVHGGMRANPARSSVLGRFAICARETHAAPPVGAPLAPVTPPCNFTSTGPSSASSALFLLSPSFCVLFRRAPRPQRPPRLEQ